MTYKHIFRLHSIIYTYIDSMSHCNIYMPQTGKKGNTGNQIYLNFFVQIYLSGISFVEFSVKSSVKFKSSE